jgi:hypothetical protein
VLLCSNYSNAQVDSTTGNLINFSGTPTGTTSNWNNGVYVNQLGCFGGNTPGNCGPYPNVQTNGAINFSYGQVDLHQIVNINKALAAGGTGVQLSGFNFGFQAKNGNGWDDGRQDYLGAYVKFYNAGGGLAANYDYTSQTNQKYNWTQFNFSETFANPTAATNYSNAQVGFVGRDNNYWAGPYGPEIINVNFSLKYRVDPCASNPAYSSTCAGFGDVINSKNLLNSSVGGGSLNQVFAVNTALGLAGSGAMVHGFNYGFNYSVGQGFYGCTAWNQDGSCSWTMNTPAYVSAAATFTNSSNQVIHQKNYSFTQEGTSGSVSEKYLLPSSMNQTLLGTGRVQGVASGTGSSITGAWANIIYTADPCAVDPLSSPTCKGYAVAYAKTLLLGSTVSNASAPNGPPDVNFGGNGPARGEGPGPGGEGNRPDNAPMAGSGPQQQDRTGPMAGGDGPGNGPFGGNGPQQSQSGPGNANDGAKMTPGAALSIARAAQEKDKAIQATAVQNAAKALENIQQSSQAASNAAITMNQDMSANSATAAAQFSNQTTQASVQTSTTQSMQATQQAQQTQTQTFNGVVQNQQTTYTTLSHQQDSQPSVVTLLNPLTTTQIETQQITSVGTGLSINRSSFSYNPFSTTNTSNITPTPPTTVYQSRLESRHSDSESTQLSISTFNSQGRTGNPLNDLIQQRMELPQSNIEQRTETVKREVQPNELAGKVDIAGMAIQPVGFTAYSFTLRDTTFYEPKEVYKNQRTVDNVRLLRGLTGGSDAKHNEMVNSQYK